MFDIIGDVHGHLIPLTALLHHLGYREDDGVWQYPGQTRRVLFVGDYIDRGPHIRETVALVRKMVARGSAVAVMGNHEYNAITWHTPDGRGDWLRTHSTVHRRQHAATLEQYGMDPLGNASPTPELAADLAWMRSLPLYYRDDRIIVVHAAWEEQAVADIAADPLVLLDDEALYRSAYGEYRESRSVEILLKGVEMPLRGDRFYVDKDGTRRRKTRVRWWLNNQPASLTMKDVAMPPADTELGSMPVDPWMMSHLPGYQDRRLIFLGHYWLSGQPAPLASRVACLDYSIARGGLLCAYRFAGETAVQQENYCAVDTDGNLRVSSSLR